jgi:hypothetical protein
MLGHARASMTLDVYADLFDDDLEAVAERLDVLARAVGGMSAPGEVAELGERRAGPLTCGFVAVLTGLEPATSALTGGTILSSVASTCDFVHADALNDPSSPTDPQRFVP